jgi:hypothetical protein
MFANLLAAPFALAALVLLYLAWKVDHSYAPWMVPFVVAAAGVFVLSPQINWWWYSRRPPRLSEGLAGMLERFWPFYQRLGAAGKQKVRDRVALFRMGIDWTAKGWPEDTVPPDVQLALAAPAIALTFERPEFMLGKFEKVIVYPRPFPSPEYPVAHASELFLPDHCLLFSGEQLMQAFIQPGQVYNVGLHEVARVFVHNHPEADFPDLGDEAVWTSLEKASGMPRTHIDAVIGLAGTEPLPVAIHHYVMFPQPFRTEMPQEAEALDRIFNLGVA